MNGYFDFECLLGTGTSRRVKRKLLLESFRRHWAVGPVLGADGTTPATGRQGKTGEATIGQAHGKYYEPSSRGSVFCAAEPGAGVAPEVTNTTTGTMTLYNPAASKMRLAILKVSISYFSGTVGAGSFYHGYNGLGVVAPSGGTLMTSNCLNIGNTGAAAAVGVARSGPTVVAGTILWPFVSSFVQTAASTNALQLAAEDVDGLITLEPGTGYSLISVLASSSSPKISCGIVWEEIPYVATVG